jgi:hypothetical protein
MVRSVGTNMPWNVPNFLISLSLSRVSRNAMDQPPLSRSRNATGFLRFMCPGLDSSNNTRMKYKNVRRLECYVTKFNLHSFPLDPSRVP